MPAVVATGIGPIILAIKAQLVAQIPLLTANPERVLILGRDHRQAPHYAGDYDVLLRVSNYLNQQPQYTGSGRGCLRVTRWLDVMPRVHLMGDPSDRDEKLLTDPTNGFFQFQEAVLNALVGFWPKDTSNNLLTTCEIRSHEAQQPEKAQDRDTPDWMKDSTRFEIEHLFLLNSIPWEPPLITTPDTLSAVRGQAFSQTFATVSGTLPFTWSVLLSTNEGLPPGLTFTGGVLSGTLSTAAAGGNYVFTVIVTDANGQRAVQRYTMPVAAITPTTLPNPTANGAYTQTMTLNGAAGSVTWSATGLPPGLTIDPASGIISGALGAASGPYTVTVTAMDTVGHGTGTYTIVVIDAETDFSNTDNSGLIALLF